MKLWENALNEIDEDLVEESLTPSLKPAEIKGAGKETGQEKVKKTDRRIDQEKEQEKEQEKVQMIRQEKVQDKTVRIRFLPVYAKVLLAAACVALLAGAGFLARGLILRPEPSQQATNGPGTTDPRAAAETELGYFSEAYRAKILDDSYKDYVAVRVCDEAYVGDELSRVTLEAGWMNSEGQYIEGREIESLRAVVYALKDIDPDTAVCLQFLDKGDALTLDHYYVYAVNGADPEVRKELGKKLNWPERPDPGPADNGTVTMTTSCAEKE